VHRWLTEQANEQNITLEEFICRSDAMARAE
jgi:hypothetical protein